MKTKLELLTICDYASISQDNKLSMMGLFDQIFVNNLPTQHSQFYIVGIITGEAGGVKELTLSIKTPSETDAIPPQSLKVTIGPNGKSNIIAGVENFPISEAGMYKISLNSDSKKLGEKEFGVFRSGNSIPKTSEKYTN